MLAGAYGQWPKKQFPKMCKWWEFPKQDFKILKNKIKVLDSINKITDDNSFVFSDQTFEHLNNPFIILKSYQCTK